MIGKNGSTLLKMWWHAIYETHLNSLLAKKNKKYSKLNYWVVYCNYEENCEKIIFKYLLFKAHHILV